MRRALAHLLLLALLSSLSPAARAQAGATPANATAANAPSENPLERLLDERVLKTTRNPVVATFLAAEGAVLVPEELRERALQQLKGALKSQTSFMSVMLSGMSGAMNSETMKKQREQAQKMTPGKMIAMGMLGVGPAAPPPVPEGQMENEMKQAMTDPWVRGIEAAQALERLGDANGAARFYVHCLEFLPADWVPASCLEGILALGPVRADTLLTWMVTEAEAITAGPMSEFGGVNLDPDQKPREEGDPSANLVQLRNGALAGLGALVGSGQLSRPRADAAMAILLARSSGKENELYYRGAAAGLGRSKDPRAVEPLRRLAKWRQDPDVKQTALRALAVGWNDEAAKKQLRGELDANDPEEQMRAAQALYETDDAAAWNWAVDVITKRRSTDTKGQDIRAQVVRDLVELGGERARSTLARALAEGAGNDWLDAWTRVALLELGDLSQMQAVEAALQKEDWTLDRRGFKSIWRAISPFLQAAVGILLSGGIGALTAIQQIKKAVQLIGNFAAGERGRYLAKVDARQGATAQLRWQAAEAIGAARPKSAVALLEKLLDDPAPPVLLAAALALAELDDPKSLDGLTRAFKIDYGMENGIPRTPEVRAALLRTAWLRAPEDPRTREMARLASADEDGALRFIGLAMLRAAPAA